MISNIKVSVCLITYNHELFIRDAIESVLMQKINVPIELFIGEDFSSDNTRIICQEYIEKYPDIIRLLSSSKNLGVMPNFTRTLRECNGKYIALCEGDDFWIDPLKLQKQVDFLEQNIDYILSFHNVIAVNVIDDKRTRTELEWELLKKKPEEIPIGHPTHTSSMLFRNVIRDYPGDFDKIISGDSYLQFILARFGKSIFQKNIYPNVRRRHPLSVWSYKSEEYKLEQGIYLYEKLLEIAINKKEVKYLNRILIKNRSRYVKFLWSNHKRRESLNCLNRTSKEAVKNRLFWYLVFYNFNNLFSTSSGYLYLKRLLKSCLH
jgi:glycosyltransferase involved in cell wall biosynthesis